MSSKTFLKTLEDMQGKTFQYGKSIHYIIGYTIDDKKERCILKTNVSSFDRPFEGMEEFLKYWMPVTSLVAMKTETDQNNEIAILLEREVSLSDELVGILKDNIAKVQNDKDYIPQAQAINNNINTIVNIEKMRLSFLGQFRPVRSTKRGLTTPA